MISELRRCSETELRDQIRYLQQTPVASIASDLRRGRLCLKAGYVRSLRTLGQFKTEFGQIGPVRAPRQEGEAKSRVADVLPLLTASPGIDDKLLTCIRELMRLEERSEVLFNTTIMDFGRELIVKDGNKRTIAFFECRRGLQDEIAFPVFLVEPSHGHA